MRKRATFVGPPDGTSERSPAGRPRTTFTVRGRSAGRGERTLGPPICGTAIATRSHPPLLSLEGIAVSCFPLKLNWKAPRTQTTTVTPEVKSFPAGDVME